MTSAEMSVLMFRNTYSQTYTRPDVRRRETSHHINVGALDGALSQHLLPQPAFTVPRVPGLLYEVALVVYQPGGLQPLSKYN